MIAVTVENDLKVLSQGMTNEKRLIWLRPVTRFEWKHIWNGTVTIKLLQ